jgi:hypothetical protein
MSMQKQESRKGKKVLKEKMEKMKEVSQHGKSI